MKLRVRKVLTLYLSTTFILADVGSVFSEINIKKICNTKRLLEKYHYVVTIVDTHIDTLISVVDKNTYLPLNSMTNTDTEVNVKKMVKGGLDFDFWAAYRGGKMTSYNISRDFRYANNSLLLLINTLYYVDNQNEQLDIARSTKEIKRLVKQCKVVAIGQIEGAYSLNKDNAIELVRQYYDLGIRSLSLTHNNSRAICEGWYEHFPDKTPSSGGLSDTGEAIIKEMNKLAMIVDITHLSEDSINEILDKSKEPVIASHTGVQSIVKTGRNLADEQLDKLAKNGGVAQVTFYTNIIGEDAKNVSSKEVCDVIDYIVNRIGIDHVGIGSDFDSAPMPIDLQNATQLPNLTKELMNRGYKKKEIYKILGGNTLRVMKKVEQKIKNKNTGKFLIIKPCIKMSKRIPANTKEFAATIKIQKGINLKKVVKKL